jgi:NADH-quinone oxidoreductase subunit A
VRRRCRADGDESASVVNPYLALLMSIGLSAAVVTIMLFMSRLIGPHNPTQVKEEIFETGNPPVGSLRGFRFSVKFYLVAIFFILFDIEVIFMYPWAIVYRRLGWMGLAEMAVFVAILAVGLAYIWRVGALEWE